MDKLEQIYKLHNLMKHRRTPISRADLEDRLGLGKATTTRLISLCRDRFNMPIEFDRDRGGYCYSKEGQESFELPGLWFNHSELLALLTSHRLLEAVQPGVLQPYIEPLRQRIEGLLTHKRAGSSEIFNRIRILPVGNRIVKLEDFQQAADALVNRKQLRIQYSSRGKGELTERWVSPQRLIYYRDNWYLDGWCHLRNGLRTFAVDHLNASEIGAKAKDIPDSDLDDHFAKTYGIFSGPVNAKAVIHFSSDAARWVADEQWHPEQESRHLYDGKWELVVPYGDPTELIRDILKFGPDAEVIAPAELRQAVAERLSQTLRKYRKMKKV